MNNNHYGSSSRYAFGVFKMLIFTFLGTGQINIVAIHLSYQRLIRVTLRQADIPRALRVVTSSTDLPDPPVTRQGFRA